jgi:hypothetical protein
MAPARLRMEEQDRKPLVASQPLVSSTCGDPPAFLQKLFAATWLAAPVLAAPVCGRWLFWSCPLRCRLVCLCVMRRKTQQGHRWLSADSGVRLHAAQDARS